jgi:hypothetical protein
MSAAKKRSPIAGNVGRWQRPVVVVLAIVATAAAIVALWFYVRPYVQMQPDYLVASESIEITPLPEWIRSNIVAETIRDAGLPPQLSILDKTIADQLTRAFGLHPWVAKVGEIQTSYPATIRVELTYRRPVAMVAVAEGLLPIDEESVLLPTADFSPHEAQKYPRVEGIASRPLKSLGTTWGDPSVTAAAHLASLLAPLVDILPSPTIRWGEVPGQSQAGPAGQSGATLLIATKSGASFIWGSAPHAERQGESVPAHKIARLRHLAATHGGLDQVPPNQRDLR